LRAVAIHGVELGAPQDKLSQAGIRGAEIAVNPASPKLDQRNVLSAAQVNITVDKGAAKPNASFVDGGAFVAAENQEAEKVCTNAVFIRGDGWNAIAKMAELAAPGTNKQPLLGWVEPIRR
jgi:hypothetical protein